MSLRQKTSAVTAVIKYNRRGNKKQYFLSLIRL